MQRPPVALSIAGSDPCGGAGIQADLRVFHAMGVVGSSAITALTVQNTQGVRSVHAVPAQQVLDQVQAVLEDLQPDAIKVGMLGAGALLPPLTELLESAGVPVVLDPVLISSSGAALLDEEGTLALPKLCRRCTLITPNQGELSALGGRDMLARSLHWTLLTGVRTGEGIWDTLYAPGGALVRRWCRQPVSTQNDHGTGCSLSSAIAAGLALGLDLESACAQAGDRVNAWLTQAAGLGIGQGRAGMVHGLLGRVP